MAEYTYGKDFAIRTEIDCIATEDGFGQYVGKITAVKIKTNGDRIRQMTDEELAKTLIAPLGYCETAKECKPKCVDCLLEWLKKEVDDDYKQA